ncbi:MAG: GNAT family N-acetyltransferase [Clostridia bacterium]|nr:GNAT family N-acetyltransferase [Clostridia bacterium]
MSQEYINITPDNLETEHLCCIIRSKKQPEGIVAKKQWLADRLSEGHIFRKLNEKATVFIEYAPLETAWVPVEGENYLYIYCLWVLGDQKGKGCGSELMRYCIEDAKARGKSGICMLGAEKQKSWLSDQAFAEKWGFVKVDSTDYGYDLLALSFDGTLPRFTDTAKLGKIDSDRLTVYHSPQCPFILQTLGKIGEYCAAEGIPLDLIAVDSLEKAKSLPCVFNNYAVFYGGDFRTVNLLDVTAVKRILRRK